MTGRRPAAAAIAPRIWRAKPVTASVPRPLADFGEQSGPAPGRADLTAFQTRPRGQRKGVQFLHHLPRFPVSVTGTTIPARQRSAPEKTAHVSTLTPRRAPRHQLLAIPKPTMYRVCPGAQLLTDNTGMCQYCAVDQLQRQRQNLPRFQIGPSARLPATELEPPAKIFGMTSSHRWEEVVSVLRHTQSEQQIPRG